MIDREYRDAGLTGTHLRDAFTIGWPTDERTPVDEAIVAIRECNALLLALTIVPQIAELGVFDALSDEPQRVEDLAATVGANTDALRRVLRFLSSYGFFIADADGRFRHSALSQVLRADHPQSQRAFLRLEAMPLRKSIVEAIGHTLRTGRAAVETVAPDGLPGYLSEHAEEASLFGQVMTAKAQRQIAAVLRAYDFSPFRSIADLGGGRGHLLRAVLDSVPEARGVLFDLPHVISTLSSLASERLSLEAGDFFKDPLPACDAYLLMNVIHDWSDEKAIAILAAVRRAIPDQGRVLLFEAELPSGPEHSLARYSDIAMLLCSSGGRERTPAQYRRLLAAAGFQLRRIIPAIPTLSIFEAVPG